jgi:hypothetical protein
MAVTLTENSIIYSDGTAQATGFRAGKDNGRLLNVQVFTSTGTWTKPTGATKAVVKLIGGGGGGAGYCESGAAGGYCEGALDVTSISSVSVTVGAGGSGVTYYTGGGNGGTTSFGSYFTATGGGGANTYSQHSGGYGGIGSGGAINTRGGAGCGHVNSVGSWSGGKGGSGYFGGGSLFIRNHGNISSSYMGKPTPAAPGAGGPGSQTDGATAGGQTGYAGENGVVIVYSYQ